MKLDEDIKLYDQSINVFKGNSVEPFWLITNLAKTSQIHSDGTKSVPAIDRSCLSFFLLFLHISFILLFNITLHLCKSPCIKILYNLLCDIHRSALMYCTLLIEAIFRSSPVIIHYAVLLLSF